MNRETNVTKNVPLALEPCIDWNYSMVIYFIKVMLLLALQYNYTIQNVDPHVDILGFFTLYEGQIISVT